MKRIPALDGLRGVAILLVLGYHAFGGQVPGGAHGVTLFFVLSGYLITRRLVDETDSTGRVAFGAFYWRRALRLLPALLLFVGSYLIIGGAASNAIYTLTYTANFHEASGGSLGVLDHTWSLAVEEHFYLLWPIIIAVTRRRVLTVGLLFAGAAGWRLALLIAGAEWDRVYYGTDTAAFALLAGCLVAVVNWQPKRYIAPALAGLVALAMVTATDSMLYLWAGFGVAALSALLVGGAPTLPVLSQCWLRWLGNRSYALYLWHPLTLSVTGSVVWGVATALIAAEVSWRLVEAPALRLRHRPYREARKASTSARSLELST